jgi:hypothetical protein
MLRRNNYHKAIVSKVKRTGFAVEIKIVASNLSEEESYRLEVERISFWKSANIELANLSSGGPGGASGVSPTDEKRRKISESLRGHVVSDEQKQKHVTTFKKNMTQERRDALRQRGLKNIDLFKEYQMMGPQASSKKVICIDDNVQFESASAAARFYNASKSAIIELCNKRRGRKSVKGKVFAYLGDA